MKPLTLYKQLIIKAARKHGINPQLVAALVKKESGFNSDAMRYEKGYRWLFDAPLYAHKLGITEASEVLMQSCSWGLMQVMGAVAREAGFHYPLFKLTRPDLGIEFGCRHFARQFERYHDLDKAIAAYNGGHGALLKNGSFSNAGYVNDVRQFYMQELLT